MPWLPVVAGMELSSVVGFVEALSPWLPKLGAVSSVVSLLLETGILTLFENVLGRRRVEKKTSTVGSALATSE